MSTMRKSRIWSTLGCCFFVIAALVWAQNRKAGLWELTTTQTWQQSPFPAGMSSAPPGGGGNSPFGGGTRTTQVCLTQQQIDKYGAIVPQIRGCQVTNIVKTASGMTADMVCTGKMSGKGTLDASFDGDHATGKIHFIGSIQAGPNTKPIEWTTHSSSIFKSADCGDVKPFPMPDK